MRSLYARGVAVALALASLANIALAQDAGFPSLLPLPPAYPAGYPVAQTAATDVLWNQGDTSPVPPAPMVDQLPSPSDQHQEQSVISPDCTDVVNGGYGGDIYSQTSCCNGFYAYGNALWMTREKRGGFVTSIDSVTNSPRLFFCSPNYGDLWYGGFEVGAGWCLGGGCNDPCGGCCQSCPKAALEFTYWGINTPDEPTGPSDPLISMIDFSDLTYNGVGMETIWSPAEHHRLQFGYQIHSVEMNLVGNCSQNGPFGCQRVGACSMAGCGGSRWGFGWMAGLRYIDYSEDFMFSTDFDDSVFDGDADEAHYEVDLDNNLFGFQLGGGLNLCLTRNVSAYATGRIGIYNNYVEQTQRIYGPAGPVTINNGPYTGEDFFVNATDNDLAIVGQFDLGARWSVTSHWSLDLGYRVVGLSGVAIAEDNVQRGNFQNLDGIADTQTQGAVLLHGGYLGATFAW